MGNISNRRKTCFPDACCITDHFHVIQELTRRVDIVRIRVQNRFRKTMNTLKPKKNNKTLTSEALIELEEASRYNYVLKKFNLLLASTNKKLLDVNVER